MRRVAGGLFVAALVAFGVMQLIPYGRAHTNPPVTEEPAWLDLMAREELGLNPDDLGSPWGAAIFSFLAFSVGAILPMLPYLATIGATALLVALALTGLALFAVGSATARLTERPPLWGGARMLLIGGGATRVTYRPGGRRLAGLMAPTRGHTGVRRPRRDP